jgi:hypothetical protein
MRKIREGGRERERERNACIMATGEKQRTEDEREVAHVALAEWVGTSKHQGLSAWADHAHPSLLLVHEKSDARARATTGTWRHYRVA